MTDTLDGVFRRFPDLLTEVRANYEAFNISSLQSLQIKEMLDLLIRISGKRPKVVSVEEQHANRFLGLDINIEKLKTVIPSPRFRSIEDSLRDMYQSVNASPLN